MLSVTEAFAELGIDGSATPDAARRAYLRRLKGKSPERDPAGFMRLRAAYELVCAELGEVFDSEDEANDDLADPSPSPQAAPPAEREPVAARTEVENEQALQHPNEHRDADLGVLQRALAAEDPSDWRELQAWFELAALRADIAPPEAGLRMILLLLEHGDAASTDAFFGSFQAWLAQVGSARLLQGGLAARWGLVRELDAVGWFIAPEVRRCLARSIRTWDVEILGAELLRFKHERKREWKRTMELLERDAPSLVNRLPSFLRRKQRRRLTLTEELPGWAYPLLALAVVLLFALCGRVSSPTRPNYQGLARSVPGRLPVEPVTRALVEGRALTTAIDHLLSVVPARSFPREVELLGLLRAGSVAGDCGRVMSVAGQLRASPNAAALAAAHSTAWERLLVTVSGMCRTGGP